MTSIVCRQIVLEIINLAVRLRLGVVLHGMGSDFDTRVLRMEVNGVTRLVHLVEPLTFKLAWCGPWWGVLFLPLTLTLTVELIALNLA